MANKKEEIITVKPIEIGQTKTSADVLSGLAEMGFQGKALGIAAEIWKKMLEKKNLTIWLGLAGAMVPAGMGKIISYLIENRMIDALVATGANLFHDLHECLGGKYWQGSCYMNDIMLRDKKVDRLYDVLVSDKELDQVVKYIIQFAKTLPRIPLTTREFFQRLAKYLLTEGKNGSIITTAWEHGVPIYCGAIGDSAIGIALTANEEAHVIFDIIEDVRETAWITAKSPDIGVIYIGGGVPKNFIQQTQVTSCLLNLEVEGHDLAIQITADHPEWGALSGCTFQEAQSWGKIDKNANHISVCADATLAFPILVSAVSNSCKEIINNRQIPNMMELYFSEPKTDLRLDLSTEIKRVKPQGKETFSGLGIRKQGSK